MKPPEHSAKSRLAWYLMAASLVIVVATALVPPWNRLHLEMQEMMYGASREVRVIDEKAAGHRPWFSVPQAQEIGRNTVGNFYRFERIEYRIDWFDLAWQWSIAAALLVAGIAMRNGIPAAGQSTRVERSVSQGQKTPGTV